MRGEREEPENFTSLRLADSLEACGLQVPPDDAGPLLDAMKSMDRLVAEGMTPEGASDTLMRDDDSPIIQDEQGRIVIERHEDGSYTADGGEGLVWVHLDGGETPLGYPK
jgi:hypothetical protein